MKTGLLYLMACSFLAGYYCANNDVAGELTALYDGLVDYTTARAAVQRRRSEELLRVEANMKPVGDRL
jgi:hypothetical protein